MSCTSSLQRSRVSLCSSRMAAQMKSSKVKSVLMACCSDSGLLSEKKKTHVDLRRIPAASHTPSLLCSNAFTCTAVLRQPFLIAGPFHLLRYKLQVVTAEDLEQTQCVAVFKLPLEAQQKPPWRTDNMFKNRSKTFAVALKLWE